MFICSFTLFLQVILFLQRTSGFTINIDSHFPALFYFIFILSPTDSGNVHQNKNNIANI